MVCSQSATLISIALLQAWCVQKHTGVFCCGTVAVITSSSRWARINKPSICVWMWEAENKPMCLSMRSTPAHTVITQVFDVRGFHFYHSVVPSRAVGKFQVQINETAGDVVVNVFQFGTRMRHKFFSCNRRDYKLMNTFSLTAIYYSIVIVNLNSRASDLDTRFLFQSFWLYHKVFISRWSLLSWNWTADVQTFHYSEHFCLLS